MQQFLVEVTSNCQLNHNQTLHLKLAGSSIQMKIRQSVIISACCCGFFFFSWGCYWSNVAQDKRTVVTCGPDHLGMWSKGSDLKCVLICTVDLSTCDQITSDTWWYWVWTGPECADVKPKNHNMQWEAQRLQKQSRNITWKCCSWDHCSQILNYTCCSLENVCWKISTS